MGIQKTLEGYGVRLNKRAGQYLVIDDALLDRLAGYADVSKEDTVLEVGTGVGNLTERLATRAKKVISIERDERLLKVAKENLAKCTNVTLIHGDATSVRLPVFNKVVANLPYGISSEITFRLLEKKFDVAVLMYQKEFAERLVAKPGTADYGRLTVTLQYRAEAEILEKIPPEVFIPRPEVFSAVVRLRPREPPFKVKNERFFLKVVRALFQHRRQRVRNSLLRSFEQVFREKNLTKPEKRKKIDERLPKEILESKVFELTPEKFGEIADLVMD